MNHTDDMTNEQKHGANMKRNREFPKESPVSSEGLGNFNYRKDNPFKMFTHLRSLKYVQRLSTVPLIQKYSLSEHCYYTGILFERMSELCGLNFTMEEVKWIYRHDVIESITGDMLRPAKNHNETVSGLWDEIEEELTENGYEHLELYRDGLLEEWMSEEGVNLWKVCDLLELWLFCTEEYELGNRSFSVCNIIKNAENLILKTKNNIVISFAIRFMEERRWK